MRLLLISIIALVAVNTVLALGVVPSSTEHTYQAGESETQQVKIINNDGQERQVLLYVEGSYSKYITLSESVIDFSATEKEHLISYTIHHPQRTSLQGHQENQLIIREIPKEGGQISASISIAAKIDVVIPYSAKYVETRLFVGDISTGKAGNFIMEANNLGTEDIANAQFISTVISTRTEEEVATLYSKQTRIPRGEKKLLNTKWDAAVPQGRYTIIGTLLYDGQSTEERKEFTIGSESITIKNIDVKDFSLGSIAKFDLILKNDWSEAIDGVYATIEVRDGSNTYDSSNTQTVSIEPYALQAVNAYIDTNRIAPGRYSLRVQLFYEGKVTEESYPITVTQDKIDTGFTGQAVTTNDETDSSSNSILIALIIIILISNMFVYYRFIKKK